MTEFSSEIEQFCQRKYLRHQEPRYNRYHYLVNTKISINLKQYIPRKFLSKCMSVLSHLHNYFNIHVCLSLPWRQPSSVPYLPKFHHVQSSRRLVRLLLSEAKPSYSYSILKPHGQTQYAHQKSNKL